MSPPLSKEQRSTTVSNAVINMRGICFFSEKEVGDTASLKLVEKLEQDAFNTCSTVGEYTKKLSESMVAAVSTLSAGDAAVPSTPSIPEDAVLGSIPTVWEQESITPILDLEAGLLKGDGANVEACKARVEVLLGMLEDGDAEATPLREAQEIEGGGVRSLLAQLPKLTPEELKRIINADTKRTFQGDLAKGVLEPVLGEAAELFDGEYHQGEARVAGFLLMMAPAAQVVRILHLLQRSPRHGVFAYWRNLAVGLAADANCVEAIIAKTDPELAEHMAKKLFLPAGTWCPKYCAALGVSMLPYPNLLTFFERFVAEGADFLVRFCLSLVKEVRPALMAAADISQALEQLEIKRHVGSDFSKLQQTIELVDRVIAGTDELKDMPLDKPMSSLREEFLDAEVQKGIARYVNVVKGDDEEEVDDCQICKDNLPDFRCNACKLVFCEECCPEGEPCKTCGSTDIVEFE